MGALRLIVAAMDNYYGAERSVSEARFCEERMWSVTGKATQLTAFRDVLIDNNRASKRLRMWAIGELIRTNTEESRHVLNSFTVWVASLPAGHPERNELEELRTYVLANF